MRTLALSYYSILPSISLKCSATWLQSLPAAFLQAGWRLLVLGVKENLAYLPQLPLEGQNSVLSCKNEASVDGVGSQGPNKPGGLQSLFLSLSPPITGVLY